MAQERLTNERKRAHIIVKLRLVLTPRRKVDVQNVEASLTAAIEDFRFSSNQLRESTAQLHEIFESTDSLGPQLERSTQKMNEIVAMMQKISAVRSLASQAKFNRLETSSLVSTQSSAEVWKNESNTSST